MVLHVDVLYEQFRNARDMRTDWLNSSGSFAIKDVSSINYILCALKSQRKTLSLAHTYRHIDAGSAVQSTQHIQDVETASVVVHHFASTQVKKIHFHEI